jgi:hypothetical protein
MLLSRLEELMAVLLGPVTKTAEADWFFHRRAPSPCEAGHTSTDHGPIPALTAGVGSSIVMQTTGVATATSRARYASQDALARIFGE